MVRPAGQGKPADAEPTPIEVAYRTLRDVQDSGLMLTKENVAGVAESVRQAAIYDASHREREREYQIELAAARADTIEANRVTHQWRERCLATRRQRNVAQWVSVFAALTVFATLVIIRAVTL